MKFLNFYRVLGICFLLSVSIHNASGQNPPAQDGRGNPGQSTQPRNTPGQSATPSTTPSQGDRDRANTATNTTAASSTFLDKAIEVSSAEIQLGQLAEKKSMNDRVKSFAQMLVKDHTEGLSQLQKAHDQGRTTSSTTNPAASNSSASSQNRPATSTSSSSLPAISSDHRKLMTRLEGMSGAQFDREYINAMVTGHRDAIKLFEKEAGSTSNTSTRSSTNSAAGPAAGAKDTAVAAARSSSSTDTKTLAAEMLPTLRKHLQEAESIQKTLK